MKPFATAKPFQIRGRFFTAVALRLAGPIDQALLDALDEQMKQAPSFFVNAPLIVDLEAGAKPSLKSDLVWLVDELRARRLSVFGVQNGTEEQNAAARDAGLILLEGAREVPVERVKRKASAAAPASVEKAVAPSTKIITEPVRSGQRIFNDRGDLIVVASVGSGAELIAEGSIHVYGSLRGRALAGVNGDTSARIFCQSLDAELIAISGLYQTSEDLEEVRNRRVQVFLRDESLCIEELK